MRFLVPVLLTLLLLPAVATAQDPGAEGVYQFDLQVEETFQTLEVNSQAFYPLTVRDLSRDGSTLVPGGTTGDPVGTLPHDYSVEVIPLQPTNGWYIIPATSFQMFAGQEKTFEVGLGVGAAASDPYYDIQVIITMRFQGTIEDVKNVTLRAYTPGISGFSAIVQGGFQQVSPNQLVDYPVRIENRALVPRAYDILVDTNPCGLEVAATTGNLVPAKTTEEYVVNVRSPGDKPLYLSELCQVGLVIRDQLAPENFQKVTLSMSVNGTFVAGQWIYYGVIFAILLLFLILFLLRRKALVEEGILGKPQKPWTIPAEQVYLRELRLQDPRAYHLVRNVLMVEEYRSSLDWYYAYKSSTKGTRSKERLILAEERKLDRIEDKADRKVQRFDRKAARHKRKMERKIAAKAKKTHRKEIKAYDAGKDKVEAKAKKAHEKSYAKWEKAAKKARKQGEDEPEAPVYVAPELAERPALPETSLDDASPRQERKLGKQLAKVERKQVKVRAKGEKDYNRRLVKVQRRVRKLAKKLDDPTFMDEHAHLF